MKTSIATLFAMLLSGMATLASAGQLASLSVINQSTGERLNIWRHEGRNYIAGNPGDRYAIEVKNQTGARLLSVISVDGVNVISGATASTSQPGYVLDGWQPIEIKGWRKNMDEVAAFYFTRLSDSYAGRTGRPENVGVIGVALFREYVEPIALSDQSVNRPAASPMAGVVSKSAEIAADEKLGTGHGERVSSATRMTDFRRASTQANEIVAIHYDTYAHLAARGIIPRSRGNEPGPAPFPGNFVPDPS